MTPLTRSFALAALLALSAGLFVLPAQAQEKGASSDALITRQVERALAADSVLRRMEIHVETLDGVVNLRGFVRTLEEIAKAGAMAGAVPGVAAVRNGLRVADRPSRS